MVRQNIKIENAQIRFRNFSGKEDKYNPKGQKNFCVLIDPELAITLEEDGWNVRYLKPREEGDDAQAYLQVAVKYENIPPKINMYTSSGRTTLDDETVGLLDWAEIQEVDLVIRPYNWVLQAGTKNEKSGVKAYLKSMHVRIYEDDFDKKWANPPMGGDDEEE